MGGPQITDSEGNVWLGDAGGDPLDIRPNDANGTQHQTERVRDQPRGHHGLRLWPQPPEGFLKSRPDLTAGSYEILNPGAGPISPRQGGKAGK